MHAIVHSFLHPMVRAALLISLLPGLSGCAAMQPKPPPAEAIASPASASTISRIAYGRSSGMCIGYCDHSLSVTPEAATLRHIAHRDKGSYPDREVARVLSEPSWRKLVSLVNWERFSALPARIGCPDCADGGAAWIEIQRGGISHRVTFEPQAGLPAQAQLLAELESIYAQLDALAR